MKYLLTKKKNKEISQRFLRAINRINIHYGAPDFYTMKTFREILNGNRHLTKKIMKSIQKKYQIRQDWILYGTGWMYLRNPNKS